MRAPLGILGVTLVTLASIFANPNPGVQFLKYPLKKTGVTGSIQKADATHDGYLSSADWITFSTETSGGGGGGGGGTSTIDPTSLGTLSMWLKADAAVFSDNGCSAVATSGGHVACWVDQSVNAFQLKNTVDATRPTLLAWQATTHPGVFFDGGASDLMALTGGPNPTSFTACTVLQLGAAIGASEVYYSVGTDATHGFRIGINSSATLTGDKSSFNGGAETKTQAVVDPQRLHAACVTFDGATGTSITYTDNTPSNTVAGGSITYVAGYATFLGAQGGVGNFFSGNLYEVLEYDSVLSTANRGKIFQYFRDRWNTSVNGGGSTSGGGGTTVTGTAPIVVTANDVSIAASTNAVDGYLTAVDHATFSAKAAGHSCDASGAIAIGSVAAGGSTSRTVPCAGAQTTSACYVTVPHAFLADAQLIEKFGPVLNGVTINYFCSKTLGTCTINATTAHAVCDN